MRQYGSKKGCTGIGVDVFSTRGTNVWATLNSGIALTVLDGLLRLEKRVQTTH